MIDLNWLRYRFRWAYVLLLLVVFLHTMYLVLYNNQLIILGIIAVYPGILYISVIRKSELDDKEPRGLIALHIAMGILIIPIAFILEISGLRLLLLGDITPNSSILFIQYIFWFIYSYFIVAICEEGLKLIAFLLLNKIHKENDSPTDSIVYTVAISGGFAIFENYKYARSAASFSLEFGYLTAIVRTFTAIPVHIGLGMIMGYFFSKYLFFDKLGNQNKDKNYYRKLAIIVPIIIHGSYDFLVNILYGNQYYADLIIAVLFSLILNFFAWKYVIKLRKSSYIISSL
ncbi:MAG: PrsW family glutamic-type intramembrane protease [Candidatus Heimdallarchaeota archaeon]|nr:PrsW family glutamic-type intramembrane protease [Candidatus Heimdallarchaeota archaeon]